MIMIDRNSFDAHTLAAMDDAARMLHIHLAVLGMNDSFKNARERGLSASEAKPAAKQILDATKAAGTSLMEAAFSRRPERIGLARSHHLTALRLAVKHASRLARQEREAFPEVGEQGVFHKHVEVPLRQITSEWGAGEE